MKTKDTKVIAETFQRISDMVTPTMGARGRLAVVADEFSRPYLTDDGVTVARECLHFEDKFEQMVALSMIEGSANTEKTAFDGTTLTVLLTNEFYKAGLRLIRKGYHPQIASKMVENESAIAMSYLRASVIKTDTDENLIRHVANITTKIPAIGELVYQAHQVAGDEMNVIIEHDRKNSESSVEHVDGMVLDSGYFSESLKNVCNEENRWVAENARCILLAEGILTQVGIRTLFGSIEDTSQPLVFFLDKDFNPESLKLLMDQVINNKLKFMFVFINDEKPEEIFLDIAAKTGGVCQSAQNGTIDYRMEYAGTASKIVVEQKKTTIMADGNKEAIDRRLASYRKEMDDNRYNISMLRKASIERRISCLDKGVTKIKLACSTVTEFGTIRMKLDDAIGAVRCACRDGVVIGAGKTLYKISERMKVLGDALKKPQETILKNAGCKISKKANASKNIGVNVTTGLEVNLLDAGIVDSYTSIEQAMKNATSIACSYLKSYILINSKA